MDAEKASAGDRPSPAGSPTLLSCTGCHGHSLTLRGKVVQCDDCGTIQPTGAGGQEKL
jgi:hypothetical protein